MLSIRLLHSATVLHSSSYYIVVASKCCFLQSNVQSSISQNVRLFLAILAKATRPSNDMCSFAYAWARVPGTLVDFIKMVLKVDQWESWYSV